MVNAINSATLMSTITTAAANWRTCLSGYADSRNSYSAYFYTAGGFYYSIMTAANTYSYAGRSYAMKAAADYRMSLMGEESSINTRTGASSCSSMYQTVIAAGLNIGDIALASWGQSAIDDCVIIRNWPVAKVDFTYSGDLGVGTTLKGRSGTWPYNVQVGYQWYRGAIAISGATSSDYVVQAADAGSQLRLRVTGSRSGLNSVSRYSGYSDTILLAQTLTPEPTLSGTKKVGNTLTASAGAWDSGVTLNYQWLRDGVPIDIATSPTYTLTSFDANKAISVRVTGSKSGYLSVAKTSQASIIAGLDLTSTPTPTFTGTKKLGSLLTVSPGSWDTGVTLSYQWLRDGVAIPGATATTYTVLADDVDRQISVMVSGSKLGYTNVSKVSASSLIEAASFTSPNLKPWLAVFGGDAAVGRTSQAALFVNETGVEFTYRWFRNGVVIPGLTTMQYVFTSEDFDSNISVEVTAKKPGYKTLVDTSDSVKVGAATQTLTPTPTISGVAKVGQTLTAVPGTWASGITLSYKWLRQGVSIPGANAITYETTGDDYLQNISVEVTGAARGFNSVSKVSATTSIAEGALANASSPGLYAPFRVGKKLTCFGNEDIWDAGVTFTYNWLLGGATFGAPQVPTYTPTPSDLGKSISCSVTGAKPGYASVTKTSASGTILPGQFNTIASSSGEFRAGSTINLLRSQWPEDANISVQWWTGKAGGKALSGANGLSYRITAADAGFTLWAVIEIVATGYESATVANGKAIYLPGTTVAQLGETNPPVISGEKRVGSPISITPGTWDAGTETTMTLQRWDKSLGTWDAVPVANATCIGAGSCVWSGSMVNTNGEFVPNDSVLGYLILLTVSGTFEGVAGSAVTYLEISKGVFNPALLPKITGTPRSGNTLTVDFSNLGSETVIEYQWGFIVTTPTGTTFVERNGATSSSIYLEKAAETMKVALRVQLSRPGFETLTYLYPYLTVSPPLLNKTPVPALTGTRKVGTTLTVVPGTWDKGTFLTVAWYRNGALIRSGISLIHVLTSADLGASITAKVTGTLSGYESATMTSDPIVVTQGTMATSTPSFTGTAKVGSVLTAKVTSWAPGAVLKYQWLLDGKAIRGATARTYKLLSTQKGKRISLTITQTAPGYVTATKTSAAIKVG